MKLNNLYATLAVILLGAFILPACKGLSTTQSVTQTSTPSVGQQTTATETGPVEVVREFLDSLVQDPSGEESKQYLSQSLREDVDANHPIESVLGVQDIFRSYGISDWGIEQDRNRAFIQAGLNYGSPVLRDFELIHQNGRWQINTIIRYDVPSADVYPYYQDANKTILDYIQALNDNQPAAAWALLQADTQLILSKPDLQDMAKTIRKINVSTMDLNNDDVDRLIYKVALWVDPNPDQKSEWVEGQNERWFELVDTEGGWRIQQISDIPLD